MFDAKKIDSFIKKVELSLTKTSKFDTNKEIYVGVDLGTAYIVIVVLDNDLNPIATEMEESRVVKDGLVVDYIGAVNSVKKLKKKLEERIGVEITKAAIAIPPGTSEGDSKTHKYVLQAAEIDVTNIIDEPTAANNILNIKNGVVVDIGGGTTGLSIFDEGKVIFTADEATGGLHLNLVIAGGYNISIEEAEKLKRDVKRNKEIILKIRPVIQKMASIVMRYIKNYEVTDIYLAGGTSCLIGIEEIFFKETGINTYKPENPFFVTPAGIAISAKQENILE